MFRFLRAIIVIVLGSAIAILQAVLVDASPVGSFDVSGVRLFMTPEEALSAIKARTGDSVTLAQTRKPCAKVHADALAHGRAPDASDDCIAEIRYTRPGLQVTYDFVEDYPANPGIMRVYAMQYYQFDFKTIADRDAFREKVTAKFGKPDVIVPDFLKEGNEGGVWCARNVTTHCWLPGPAQTGFPPLVTTVSVPNGVPGAFDYAPLPSFVPYPDLEYPLMTLLISKSGATLSLADLHYAQSRTSAVAHLYDSVKTGVKTTL